MNRKERRAADKRLGAVAAGGDERWHLERARALKASGRPKEALLHARSAVALAPLSAEAQNTVGSLLLEQGRRTEAAVHLERTLVLAPELYERYGQALAILYELYPVLETAVDKAAQAWPARLGAKALFGADGLAAAALASNAFLRRVLESHTACDLAFERFLTTLRALIAAAAWGQGSGTAHANERLLPLACALARQCFLNDYVFATTPEEAGAAAQERQAAEDDLAAGRSVAPLRIAALASYAPLGELAHADRLLDRDWPAALSAVVAQQIAAPRAEREIASAIPRLTAIADPVSAAVRRQYEENPYPRWVHPASQPERPETLHGHLRASFPFARIPDRTGVVDMLVAGCGTGRHPVEVARRFANLRILAIDLSLASLAYAQRQTLDLGLGGIDYAQADILELGGLGRAFDAIDAGGVLHHLADPFAGWRILLALLRPNGVMRVALYSAAARRDVAAARRFVAEEGFAPTADGIRAARAALLASPLRTVAARHDFYSVSECRDLLFHVQERGLTLPEIKAFVQEAGLRLIGFDLPDEVREAYARRFPDDRAMADLDCWNAFEQDQPTAFAAMYQFWVAND